MSCASQIFYLLLLGLISLIIACVITCKDGLGSPDCILLLFMALLGIGAKASASKKLIKRKKEGSKAKANNKNKWKKKIEGHKKVNKDSKQNKNNKSKLSDIKQGSEKHDKHNTKGVKSKRGKGNLLRLGAVFAVGSVVAGSSHGIVGNIQGNNKRLA